MDIFVLNKYFCTGPLRRGDVDEKSFCKSFSLKRGGIAGAGLGRVAQTTRPKLPS